VPKKTTKGETPAEAPEPIAEAAAVARSQPTPPPPPVLPPAPPAATQEATAPAGDAVEGVDAPPQPAKARSRRKLVLAITVPIAAVLLLAGGLGGAYAFGVAQHTPERLVSSYLDDLIAGDAESAVARFEPAPELDLSLTSNEVFQELDGRVTEYRIEDVSTIGDQAEVTVLIATADDSWSNTFELIRTGSDGLFHIWTMDGASLPYVAVAVPFPGDLGIEVNGVPLEPAGDGSEVVEFVALPGAYEIVVTGDLGFGGDDELLSASTRAVTVASLVRQDGGGGTKVIPELALTEAGAAKAVAAVNGWINGCVNGGAGSFGLSAACGGYAVESGAQAGDSYTRLRWTLKTAPVFELGDWSAAGWSVTTTKPGYLRWDADFSNARYYGTQWADHHDYQVSGVVTLGDDGTFFYTSDWS
jgi:hypothetical protein